MKKFLFLVFLMPVFVLAQNQQTVFDNLRGHLWKVHGENFYYGFSKDNSSLYIFSNPNDVIGSLINKISWSVDDKGKLIFGGSEPRAFELTPNTSFNLIWNDENGIKADYAGLFRNDPTGSVNPNPTAGKATSINDKNFQGVIIPYVVEKGEPGLMVTYHTTVSNPKTGNTAISLWTSTGKEFIKTNQNSYSHNGNLVVSDNVEFSRYDLLSRAFRNSKLFIPYSVLRNSGLSGWQNFYLMLRAFNSVKGELQATPWMPVKVYIPQD